MPTPEPEAHSATATEGWVYGVAFVIFLVLTVLSVVEAFEVEASARVAPHAGSEPSGMPSVESLTCFTCHSLATYRNGGDGAFPHSFHLEFLDLGNDCHRCHAFTQHALEPVTLPDCADCH
jgi:hypothetical protein